jgi:hypothetical protein
VNDDAEPTQEIAYVLLARIISVLLLMSLIVFADAVDDTEFQWYQKAAWGILYVFSFLGAVI